MDTENYNLLAKYDDGFPVLPTLVIPTGYVVGVPLQGDKSPISPLARKQA
jgi:hypothetical protein